MQQTVSCTFSLCKLILKLKPTFPGEWLPGNHRAKVEKKFKVEREPRLLQSHCTSQPQRTFTLMILSTFQKPNMNSRSHFLLSQLCSTLLWARGWPAEEAGDLAQISEFSSSEEPALPCWPTADAASSARILTGLICEWRGWKWNLMTTRRHSGELNWKDSRVFSGAVSLIQYQYAKQNN